jgi:hypothetical protein
MARHPPREIPTSVTSPSLNASSTAATGRCQSRVSGAPCSSSGAPSRPLAADHVPASIAQRCQDRKELRPAK